MKIWVMSLALFALVVAVVLLVVFTGSQAPQQTLSSVGS